MILTAQLLQGSSPISGTYKGQKEVFAGTISVVREALKLDMWDVTVTNVIASGEQAAVTLTVKSEGTEPSRYYWDHSKKMVHRFSTNMFG